MLYYDVICNVLDYCGPRSAIKISLACHLWYKYCVKWATARDKWALGWPPSHLTQNLFAARLRAAFTCDCGRVTWKVRKGCDCWRPCNRCKRPIPAKLRTAFCRLPPVCNNICKYGCRPEYGYCKYGRRQSHGGHLGIFYVQLLPVIKCSFCQTIWIKSAQERTIEWILRTCMDLPASLHNVGRWRPGDLWHLSENISLVCRLLHNRDPDNPLLGFLDACRYYIT
jgi:hypothetical protein